MPAIRLDEFKSEYFTQVLCLLQESNCLHAQNAPCQFRCSAKESSIPYLNCILQQKDNFGYVALAQDQVVGALLAGEKQRDENIYQNQVYWQIFDLVVSCEHQSQGIGRQLINKIINEARKKHICQLELEVFNFNNRAAEFYRRLNFTEISRNMALYIN